MFDVYKQYKILYVVSHLIGRTKHKIIVISFVLFYVFLIIELKVIFYIFTFVSYIHHFNLFINKLLFYNYF